MPAAAVIPAPIAYTKVVAVKKLVVEIVSCGVGLPFAVRQARLRGFSPVRVIRRDVVAFARTASKRTLAAVYFEQIRVLKAGLYLPEYCAHGIIE